MHGLRLVLVEHVARELPLPAAELTQITDHIDDHAHGQRQILQRQRPVIHHSPPSGNALSARMVHATQRREVRAWNAIR